MYTARQVFDATAIELSKMQAPTLKLYEFNYLFNKAINQFTNKVYNIYDINQQTTDDLRVLKSSAYLKPVKFGETSALKTADANASSYLSTEHSSIQSLYGATYEVYLPLDYLHLLNCVCVYYVAKQKDCWDAGSYIQVPATRLTADSWSLILDDVYNRPTPMRPYYYIHNTNNPINTLPTNPVVTDINTPSGYNGTDINGDYHVTSYDQERVASPTNGGGSNYSRTFKLNNTIQSGVEKPIASRIGNASNIRLEIRYGRDDSVFQLREVHIDYVKVPQYIRLTQEQMDLTEDTSQIMEFPDYVCQEIINELVHLVMERMRDPRLPSNVQISQSIARPTQQQQQPAE